MSFFLKESQKEKIQINSSLDVILEVRNETGSQLPIGTPIYLSGHNYTLDIPLIDIANANDENKMPCIGITQENIENNTNGFIKQLGKLDLDTSSFNFTLGDTLYVSTSGTLTNIEPLGANINAQSVGIMGYKHTTDGFIIVKTIGSAISTDLELDVAQLEIDVTTLQGNVVILESDVSNIESNITILNSIISNAQILVSSLESNLDIVSNSVTSLESNIILLQSNVSNIASDILTIESNISTIQLDVTNIESNIIILNSNVSNLQSNINILESNVSNLQSNIITINTDINTIEGNISTIEYNINTVEGNISTIEGNISIIESNISSIEVDISTIESNISSIDIDITNLESNISTLETNYESIENDFIGVHLSYVNSNLNLDSAGNINLLTDTGNVFINGILISDVGGVELPLLGDSNIYIGDGSNTSQVSISGDIILSNTGVTQLISISNTDTISSSANIKLDTDKHIYFNDTNKYINYNGSNLDININNGNINLNTNNGKTHIYSNLSIDNDLSVGNDLSVNNNLTAKTITITDQASILGNLSVIGNTITVNSNVTTIDDPVIEIGTSSPSEVLYDRGIKGNWYNGANKTLFFGMDRSTQKFTFIPDATYDSNTGNLVTSGLEGDAIFNNIESNSTTESISTDTGALIVKGGVGITSNLYVGGNIYISASAFINGSNTIQEIENINYSLSTLETSNTSLQESITSINSNISNISVNNSNLDIVLNTGNINLNPINGNVFVNGELLAAIGGSIEGITYQEPDLTISSITGNIEINANNTLNLGNHTILSNTFTLEQDQSSLSGTQSVTLDFNNSSDFYFTVTTGSNITLNNPSNTSRVGQQGSLIFKTSGTGHILNWYSGGKWYFNSGLAPSFTGSDSTIDIFSYIIVEENIVVINDAVNFIQY